MTFQSIPLSLLTLLAGLCCSAQGADNQNNNSQLGNTDNAGSSNNGSLNLFDRGGPVGYWAFDEGKGSVAHDSSGNGYDGTIVGALFTPGVIGTALEMGQDRYVMIGREKELALSDTITIAAWVRAGDAGETSFMRILSKKADFPTRDGYEMEYNFRTGELDVIGSGDLICRASGVHLDGNWHHLTGVIDKDRGHLYVDGIERPSTGLVGKPKKDKTTPVVIGRLAGKPFAFFYRTLDEVRLYDYALTPAEVAALVLLKSPLSGGGLLGLPNGNG